MSGDDPQVSLVTSDTPFARVLEKLQSRPSRTWSIIITFYGDALMPRGKSLWLGTLLAFFKEMGVAEGVVRTAMSRLASDGWLERNKVGRNSYYRLAERGRATFEAASGRIYSPEQAGSGIGLTMLFLSQRDDRDQVQAALAEAGFGTPAPGVWIASSGSSIPGIAGGEVAVTANGGSRELSELASRAWPLGEINDHYRDFIATFGAVLDSLDRGYTPTDAEAAVMRVLMVHEFRRIVLKAPILPEDVFPTGWLGRDARKLASKLYAELADPSERWLDSNGLDEAGRLNAPSIAIRTRINS